MAKLTIVAACVLIYIHTLVSERMALLKSMSILSRIKLLVHRITILIVIFTRVHAAVVHGLSATVEHATRCASVITRHDLLVLHPLILALIRLIKVTATSS